MARWHAGSSTRNDTVAKCQQFDALPTRPALAAALLRLGSLGSGCCVSARDLRRLPGAFLQLLLPLGDRDAACGELAKHEAASRSARVVLAEVAPEQRSQCVTRPSPRVRSEAKRPTTPTKHAASRASGVGGYALQEVAGCAQVHESVADLMHLGKSHRQVVTALGLQAPVTHLRGQCQRVAQAADRRGMVLDAL